MYLIQRVSSIADHSHSSLSHHGQTRQLTHLHMHTNKRAFSLRRIRKACWTVLFSQRWREPAYRCSNHKKNAVTTKNSARIEKDASFEWLFEKLIYAAETQTYVWIMYKSDSSTLGCRSCCIKYVNFDAVMHAHAMAAMMNVIEWFAAWLHGCDDIRSQIAMMVVHTCRIWDWMQTYTHHQSPNCAWMQCCVSLVHHAESLSLALVQPHHPIPFHFSQLSSHSHITNDQCNERMNEW